MNPLGGPEILIIILIGIVFVAIMGLWIWSLIHCIRNKQLSENNRIIGIVLIAILGLIGSLIYLFLPREQQGGGTLPPNDPRLTR